MNEYIKPYIELIALEEQVLITNSRSIYICEDEVDYDCENSNIYRFF